MKITIDLDKVLVKKELDELIGTYTREKVKGLLRKELTMRSIREYIRDVMKEEANKIITALKSKIRRRNKR